MINMINMINLTNISLNNSYLNPYQVCDIRFQTILSSMQKIPVLIFVFACICAGALIIHNKIIPLFKSKSYYDYIENAFLTLGSIASIWVVLFLFIFTFKIPDSIYNWIEGIGFFIVFIIAIFYFWKLYKGRKNET